MPTLSPRITVRAGQTECIVCERGTAAIRAGSSSCELCTPGRAVGTSSATSCFMCSTGQYASSYRMSACAGCSANRATYTATMQFSTTESRWINIEGSTSEAD
eukprot:1787374-Amphidinium_carterae.1